ncbi:hypothetical protein NQZ68_040361 [Dissostichus eleginoides]|nr:hypothetical protein NQZ68_040361 [Dissostichus eleginoides]
MLPKQKSYQLLCRSRGPGNVLIPSFHEHVVPAPRSHKQLHRGQAGIWGRGSGNALNQGDRCTSVSGLRVWVKMAAIPPSGSLDPQPPPAWSRRRSCILAM